MPYKENKGENIDEFGIKKIYGDKDNSYGWYMNMDDLETMRLTKDDVQIFFWNKT